MFRLTKWIIFLLISNSAAAECNLEYKFLNELNNPKNIKSIDIEIPKSGNLIETL